MDFPQIRIQSTPAKLGLITNPSNVLMKQPNANQRIEQPSAEVKIDRIPSKLIIDQTEAKADEGIKTRTRVLQEYVQKGKQEWLKGIARRARDGAELAAIQNKGNPIATIAKKNGTKEMKQFGIGWIPSANSVKINYDPGEVNISVKLNKPIIENKQNKPIVEYTPGNIEVKLIQYPSLEIDFENLKYVGVNYEQSI